MSKKLNKRVPELRFSKYEGNWEDKTLAEVANVQTGPFGSQLKNEQYITGGTPVVTVEHIKDFWINNFDYPSVTDEDRRRLRKYSLESGDIVFSRVGSVDLSACVEDYQEGWLFSSRMLRVRPNQQLKSKFLAYFLQQTKIRRYIIRISVGSTMPSLNTEILQSLPIKYCSLAEQEKIASFLGAIDTRLTQLRRKHELLQTYKWGVMQKIFSQELRFKDDDGNSFLDWETNRIDNFLIRYNKPVDVQLDTEYSQIGIRSHGKGVFHKEPVTGRDLGNKRVYWVHPKSFVINIVFAWEQAVALTSVQEDGFIGSHRFLMFLPKNNKVNLKFVLLFFLSKRGKSLLGLASPGGAGRNKTLGQQNFLELQVTFPTLEEQEKIANFLAAIDRKLEVVAQQIDRTEQFKKGLFQKMFV